LDVQKISNLGWKPSISLDEGIKATVEWYIENK
jgi:nucleoside-diphosphate-sugar epimerase